MFNLKYLTLVVILVVSAMPFFVPAFAESFTDSIVNSSHILDSILDALNYVTLRSSVFIMTTSPPIIMSLVVDDPDDLDEIYSTGDTITITFDSDTNEPGGTGMQTRSTVDDLFTFTESLGDRYGGRWSAPDTFIITIIDVNNAGPPVVGVTIVTPAGTTPILSADGTSNASSVISPVLSGDFGVMQILDWIIGAFNAISFTAGNVGIGTDNPNSKLQVIGGYVQLDTSSGIPPGEDCDSIDEIGRMKVDDSSLTLYVCAYDGSTHTWMSMQGDVSIIQPSPIITLLIANDPNDADEIYSTGDTITITFDSDTNMPGGTETQTRTTINDMFTFSESLGRSFSGEWITPDTFVITINNVNNAGPPVIGNTTVIPAGVTLILSADGTSEPSTITSPVLSGDFGIIQ